MRNRLAMLIVLALALALPLAARGEGADVLVETFIQRTGIQADAALREKIGTFLREKYFTPQVLEMIRSESKVDGIPVIFLTGKGDRESVMKVLAMKPDGYLLKSMERAKLLAAIDDFFEKQKYQKLHDNNVT